MPEIEAQDESSDWLGDVAEAYVAYCFAREGFEVFGSGKWAADLAVRNLSLGDTWYRVEVKSTDRDRAPLHKSLREMAKKAELYASIQLLPGGELKFKLQELSISKPWQNLVWGMVEKKGDIKNLLSRL